MLSSVSVAAYVVVSVKVPGAATYCDMGPVSPPSANFDSHVVSICLQSQRVHSQSQHQ